MRLFENGVAFLHKSLPVRFALLLHLILQQHAALRHHVQRPCAQQHAHHVLFASLADLRVLLAKRPVGHPSNQLHDRLSGHDIELLQHLLAQSARQAAADAPDADAAVLEPLLNDGRVGPEKPRVEGGRGEEQPEVLLADGDVGRLHAALHDRQDGAAEEEVGLGLQQSLHGAVEEGLDADGGGLEPAEKLREEDGGEGGRGGLANGAAMEREERGGGGEGGVRESAEGWELGLALKPGLISGAALCVGEIRVHENQKKTLVQNPIDVVRRALRAKN